VTRSGPNRGWRTQPKGHQVVALLRNTPRGLWQEARASAAAFFFYSTYIQRGSVSEMMTDAQLGHAISVLNADGIQIGLEVGALKEWGGDGAIEFNATKSVLDRIRELGGTVGIIKMDEPLSCALHNPACLKTMSQAVDATVNYVSLAKAMAPQTTISDIEPYPSLSEDTLLAWIRAYAVKAGRDFPFFILDVDYAAIRALGKESVWAVELDEIRRECKARQISFGIIFWHADFLKSDNDLTSDSDFYAGTAASLHGPLEGNRAGRPAGSRL
jgi:hypothetical protein